MNTKVEPTPAKVIDVEDTMPYVEVMTDAERAKASIKRLAKAYTEDANLFREARDYESAAESSAIASGLMSVTAYDDPLERLRLKLRSVTYQINELRWVYNEARRELRKEGEDGR